MNGHLITLLLDPKVSTSSTTTATAKITTTFSTPNQPRNRWDPTFLEANNHDAFQMILTQLKLKMYFVSN